MKMVFLMNTAFPYGQAFSARARSFLKLFFELGYSVHIIAPESRYTKSSSELIEVEYTIEYINSPQTAMKLCGIGTAKPYITALKKYAETNKVDLILSNDVVFIADKIYEFAKKKHIPYIMEQCEWYDASMFKGGRLNPYWREHINLITKKNQRLSGVIAISRLLENHYRKNEVPVIRIPTIMDVVNIKFRTEVTERNIIRIVFAGTIGKGKENFSSIFSAIKKVNGSQGRIVLDIYGPSEKDILNNLNNNIDLFNSTKGYIHVMGKIPQEEIENKLREADYTIFVRPDRRSSHAGFPTKLAESLSVGTPVITNVTGDVGLYLVNGKNSFILQDDSTEAISFVLEKLVTVSINEMNTMRVSARNTAEHCFDYRNYLSPMKDFMNNIRTL